MIGISQLAMFDDTGGYTETDQHPSTLSFGDLIRGFTGILILY